MHILWAIYFFFLSPLLQLFWWIIIVGAVLSWLVVFRVVNPHNQLVSTIQRFTFMATEPFLRPLRRFVPYIGGLDITPIILLLAIEFVRVYVLRQLITMVAGPIG